MSDKYVIRNCPAYSETQGVYWTCYEDNNKLLCQDCTDCIIKQIVQVCNEYSDKWEDCDFSNGLSDEIFKLLDIEEVE